MVAAELISYIKSRQAQGATPDQIKKELIAKAWNETDILEAFTTVSHTQAAPSPQKPSFLTGVMKFIVNLVILGALAYGGFLLYTSITTPVKNAIANCFAQSSMKSEALGESVQSLPSDAEKLQRFCSEGGSVVIDLVKCVNDAKLANTWGAKIVELFTPPSVQISPLIEDYNAKCPDTKLNIYY